MGKYILADRQELTRYAVEGLILQEDASSIIIRISDKAGLVELLKEHPCAIVVLDYTLFDFVDIEQLLIVSERFALSHWILISDDLTPDFMSRLVYSTHQFSIVFKDSPLWEIREALTAAVRHERYFSQRVLESIINWQEDDRHDSVLTATEMEIVKAIAKGKTTKEIAEERFSSIHTITTHRKNIFRKLGVNTAHEVIKCAIRSGWVDPAEFYI